MPDEIREVAVRLVTGTWGHRAVNAPGVLRLFPDTLEVALGEEDGMVISYDALSGAGWSTGRLTIHGRPGSLSLESDDGMDQAWVGLTSCACRLPEFTRGLRALGSRRGGDHDAQARFFAPLLHARRRLEEEPDPGKRVAAFDAGTLRGRLDQALRTFAAESYPRSAPDRRALQAELLDLAEPLFSRLSALEKAALRWHDADESRRFDLWREWVSMVGRVFADADRSWARAAPLIPAPRAEGTPRRGWWSGAGVVLLTVARLPGILQ
jgi:hypothetical protein